MAVTASVVNVDKIRTLRRAEEHVAQIEDDLKAARAEVARHVEDALSDFERDGIQNVTVDGRVFYLHRVLRVSARRETGGAKAVTAALRDEGLDDLVHDAYSSQTLAAWVREREKLGEALPARIEPLRNVYEQCSVRNRTA